MKCEGRELSEPKKLSNAISSELGYRGNSEKHDKSSTN
jgi:hypothetical protein